MTDNVTLSAGDNPTLDLATDEIAGVHYQKVKLIDATADSTTAIGVAANPLHVQAASLPLPAGGSTSANQVTIIGHVDGIEAALTTLNAKDFATQTTLAALNTKVTACDTGAVTIAALPNEGQQTMANSISVAIASNQSAVPINDNGGSITVDGAVSVSGTINVGNISGTVNLPTGASTAALQTSGNASLTSIDDKITACNTGAVTITALPNEGQQSMANSISVAIASDQSALSVNQGTPAGSGAGWRSTLYGPSALPTVYFNIASVYEVPAVVIGDPYTGSPWNFVSGRGLVQNQSTLNAGVRIAASVTVVTLLAAQPLRVGYILFNDSTTATMYVKEAAGATLTDWTFKLFPQQAYIDQTGHTGIVSAIWDIASGNVNVTEKY